MSKSPADFFNHEVARNYDERNNRLSLISDCLHFLMNLTLKDLPARARVLCVGAGTGAEILSLARAFPDWTFVALDPSLPMLDVCRERMARAGLTDRCEFVHGYAGDLPLQPGFDAVFSILVAHFVGREERASFFRQMTERLKTGGWLVNAEISFDLDSAEFPSMLKNWESIQGLMGATPESLAGLPRQLRETLTVLPPSQTEDLLRQAGIALPVRFYQAFMVSAWSGVKCGESAGPSERSLSESPT